MCFTHAVKQRRSPRDLASLCFIVNLVSGQVVLPEGLGALGEHRSVVLLRDHQGEVPYSRRALRVGQLCSEQAGTWLRVELSCRTGGVAGCAGTVCLGEPWNQRQVPSGEARLLSTGVSAVCVCCPSVSVRLSVPGS